LSPSNKSGSTPLDQASRLVRRICRVAGEPRLIDRIARDLARRGVRSAIRRRDTAVLVDWLLEKISYQGIGNHVADGYMERHGRVRWQEIAALIAAGPSCPKLRSYWQFDRCGYQKVERCCAEPDHFASCPLPTHDLRNGRLNQAAYSLFLFLRDIAGGDIVGWVDQRLDDADRAAGADRVARLKHAVVEPLSHVHRVSNKVLSMAFADLLLAGDARRTLWTEAGGVLIAVDTLVHNFLHRTGTLRRLGANHLYGPACYAPDGCADILERVAATIDARRFNPAFPANFPRFAASPAAPAKPSPEPGASR
jgi:hypothetical protein